MPEARTLPMIALTAPRTRGEALEAARLLGFGTEPDPRLSTPTILGFRAPHGTLEFFANSHGYRWTIAADARSNYPGLTVADALRSIARGAERLLLPDASLATRDAKPRPVLRRRLSPQSGQVTQEAAGNTLLLHFAANTGTPVKMFGARVRVDIDEQGRIAKVFGYYRPLAPQNTTPVELELFDQRALLDLLGASPSNLAQSELKIEGPHYLLCTPDRAQNVLFPAYAVDRTQTVQSPAGVSEQAMPRVWVTAFDGKHPDVQREWFAPFGHDLVVLSQLR